MNKSLNDSAQVFVATLWGKIVGFIAVLHFPHPSAKNIKRISRIVVLPDYQGIGVGRVLINWVADYYSKKGFRMMITTSHPAINKTMRPPWKLLRQGRVHSVGKTSSIKGLDRTITMNRHTCSWEYKP